MSVADRQRSVEGTDPFGVGDVGRTNLHAGAVGQLDDLGSGGGVHLGPFLPIAVCRGSKLYPTGYHAGMPIIRGLVAGLAGFSLLFAACGGDDPAVESAGVTSEASAGEDVSSITGISTVSVDDAAALVDDPPADLVVLDVRTPEEFAEGHLDGAVLVDFYDADFADQLAALDPDVPYLVYCRSGNRSGQALSVMEQLGFSSAVDVDGGIVAWAGAGLPVTGG